MTVADTASPVEEIRSRREWDALLTRNDRPSFLQSWEWGEVKREFGWIPRRLALAIGDAEPTSGIQVLVKTRALLGEALRFGIAYAPRGPFGCQTSEECSLLLESAAELARHAGASFLRVEPPIESLPQVRGSLESAGYRAASQFVQIRNTAYVDLTRTEDQILAGFKSKTRYNVRLGVRRGVEVRNGVLLGDLESFYRLTVTTGVRDGFAVHGPEYYRAVWDHFGDEKRRLFLASVSGEDVAALFAVRCGKMATYLYGASSGRHRNTMPNHLLQWEAMRWAKNQNCSTYDFWGMADPNAENDPMAGVHRFKAGFQPIPVAHPGTFDLPLSLSAWVAFTRIAMPIRTWLQRRLPGRSSHAPPA